MRNDRFTTRSPFVRFRRVMLLASAAAVAGCAGGGGAPNPVVSPAPAATPTPSGHALATATVTFVIPFAPSTRGSSREPAYISTKTVAIAAVLQSADAFTPAQVAAYDAANGAPVAQTLGGGSCPAMSYGYACTLALSLPAGSDALTFTTYDGPTASAHVLSQMTQTFALQSGVANTYTLTLDANTAAFTVTPPAGVTLAGTGCPGTTIAGSGDLSATCTATLAAPLSPAPLAFSVSIADLAAATIPTTTTGFPTLTVASSNPSAFTASISGETVTVTPVAPACPAAGPVGTTTITITSTPATPSTDGLHATSIAFTLAVAPYTGQRVYVSNYDAGTILVYPAKPAGTVNAYPLAEICNAPGAGASTLALSHPGGIAIDPAGKHLYVSNFDGGVNDAGFVSIFALPTGFAALAPAGTIDDSNGVLSAPESVAVDASDRVYLSNRGNTNAGSIQIYADPLAAGASPAAAPLTSVTGLNEPFGVELDASGRIYLAQYSANALDIYSAYTAPGIAPQRLAENSTTFPPFADTVNDPTDVAVAPNGQIYVLNLSTDSVGVYSAFSTPGVAPSLAGTLGTGYDGLFLYPYGIALDAANGVYVTDADRGTVSYFAPFAASAPPSAPTGIIAGAATGIAPAAKPYPSTAYGIAIY